MCEISKIHTGLKVVFFSGMLLPLITIIMHECSQALNTYHEKSRGNSKYLLGKFFRQCLLDIVNSLDHFSLSLLRYMGVYTMHVV